MIMTGKTIRITVPGEPIPKGRPRFTKTGHAYTPGRTKSFESFVKGQAAEQVTELIRGPVMMDVRFRFNRPGHMIWKKKPMVEVPKDSRPDLDNLIKSVTDPLNKIAYVDDGQIFSLHAEKWYCSGDEMPGAEIKITEW